MYPIYCWSDKSELKKLDTYKYWNNENEEKKKEWDIRDGNFKKMESYLCESGLKKDLLKALKLSGLCGRTMLKGVECGGGYAGARHF